MKYSITQIVITVFAIALVGCGSSSTDKKAELDKLIKEQAAINDKINALRKEIAGKDDNAKTKKVEVADLAFKPFVHYIDVQAKVDGDQNVNVAPQMPGTIKSIAVREGQSVTKGQLLATLDDAVILQGISELQTQLDFATTVFKKQDNLWKQKIGSEIQYMSAKNNKDALEKKMATLREQWRMAQIHSPINGTVDIVHIKEGQAIAPGMPCINVVNLNGLKIKGELAEANISKVKVGDEIILTFPDASTTVIAKASFVSKIINPLSRTFTVEAKLETNTAGLRPGMVAVMKVADYSNKTAIAIPINTVQSDANGNYVVIANTSGDKVRAAKSMVETGSTYQGMVEVKSGLKEGDKLIVKGFQGLNEGDAIEF